jgi:hypothetical protein
MVSKKTDNNVLDYLLDHVKVINDSKLFAGLMIIVLNVASKFVNIKLSKTIESYMKNTFSRNILVFAIAWMGTRDIWVAVIITIVFVFLIDYLLNEESIFCCLPEHFTNYHLSLLDDSNSNCKSFTAEEVEKAYQILEKAQLIIEKSKIAPSVKPSVSTSLPESSIRPFHDHTILM